MDRVVLLALPTYLPSLSYAAARDLYNSHGGNHLGMLTYTMPN